jgi:hypothetical protein
MGGFRVVGVGRFLHAAPRVNWEWTGCGQLVSSLRVRLIAAVPIDHIAKRPAIEVGAKVFAEQVDGAVPVPIAGP